MNKLLTFATIALGLSCSAGAASSGDILLGFKSTNVADLYSTTFNVASVATLMSQTPGTTVWLTNVSAVLDGTFGLNWKSRTDIQWGVLGNVRAADDFQDAFGYHNNPIVASRTVPYNNTITAGFAAQGARWANAATGVGGVGTSSTLLNTNTASWKFNYGPPSVAFSRFHKASATFGAFDNSTNFTSVPEYTTKLYRYVATDATDNEGNPAPDAGAIDYLGDFTLTSDGDLTFTAAIPESTSYAALLGAAAFAFTAISRRRQPLNTT